LLPYENAAKRPAKVAVAGQNARALYFLLQASSGWLPFVSILGTDPTQNYPEPMKGSKKHKRGEEANALAEIARRLREGALPENNKQQSAQQVGARSCCHAKL
jgi:hypothetical protein